MRMQGNSLPSGKAPLADARGTGALRSHARTSVVEAMRQGTGALRSHARTSVVEAMRQGTDALRSHARTSVDEALRAVRVRFARTPVAASSKHCAEVSGAQAPDLK
jgi:hypothetical protein